MSESTKYGTKGYFVEDSSIYFDPALDINTALMTPIILSSKSKKDVEIDTKITDEGLKSRITLVQFKSSFIEENNKEIPALEQCN